MDQQVFLISGQAWTIAAKRHENHVAILARKLYILSHSLEIFYGYNMFSFTPCVFHPVHYSNGRKWFVSDVISCRFTFYQICQFCHIIVWLFSSLMYVTGFLMPMKTVFKLDCERI